MQASGFSLRPAVRHQARAHELLASPGFRPSFAPAIVVVTQTTPDSSNNDVLLRKLETMEGKIDTNELRFLLLLSHNPYPIDSAFRSI